MLARRKKLIVNYLLACSAAALMSCATEKKEVSVVRDPDGKKESAIPWNQQEKWEQGAEMGAMANTDRAH